MTPRTCTPTEAAAAVSPRDSLAFGLGPGIPDAFLRALGERDDWEDLVVGGALLLDYYTLFTRPGVSYRCGFFGPAERILLAEGHHVDLVPSGFRQFAPTLAQFSPRVLCAQAAPARDGLLSLSLHYGGTRDELLAAGRDPDRLLVIEVNPHLPWTRSHPPYDNTIPLELVDLLVEADGVPYALEDEAPSDAERLIARHALDFVHDGATLQTGIGAVPGMVATTLAEQAGGDYGVHSEMFTTGLMRLHQAGKVTNAHKGQFAGYSVTTFALGTAELYRWLDNNQAVAFLPVEVVNDPTVIGNNAGMVSINGALGLDLYGQVVADNIGARQISGVGGHEDFVAAADLRLDAHSLICLTSTVEVGGEVRSRIVPMLPAGAVVSTPRHHTNVVVTEHGSAELRGLTVAERAHALAELADPAFRAELHAAADTLGR